MCYIFVTADNKILIYYLTLLMFFNCYTNVTLFGTKSNFLNTLKPTIYENSSN